MSTVAFFEVEAWEEEYLANRLQGVELRFSRSALQPAHLAAMSDVEVLSIFIRSPITSNILEQIPHLRLVVTRSTGYDHIDLEACRRRGVVVCNVPRYGENTVAEHTFALILALSRNIHKAYVRTVRGDFSLHGLRGFDLKGKILGVVGTGSIGLHVIRIARGFNMEVLAYDIRPQPLLAEVLGFRYVSLEELLRESDIVTLHIPLTPATHHLMDWSKFQQMKRGAILINTARGGVVDTDALLRALDEGILSGAGLDVLEGEELIEEERALLHMPEAEEKLKAVIRAHVLLRRENVVITPHIAFNSQEALQRILDTTIENIQAFFTGAPQNVVNVP
ncbi:MAG: hydroxyacid dehydrogenase [Armatimonadota bacterium]|nr:hydroxyacid dehydrogenase [Armatimonadota bacterium]MDR5702396.1 hydroxyacid dehydrogenase [Armatimonadota bacterium]MDR7435489.1 hydroxyacid dehydrogenase [Armatimonadota bacterium]